MNKLIVIVSLAFTAAAAGCGGSDGADPAPPPQQSSLESAAQRLDTYLQSHTKGIASPVTTTGPVVSLVEPSGDKLKVYADLNSGVARDAKPARQLCRVIRASGVPEARGAILVDIGDSEMLRC